MASVNDYGKTDIESLAQPKLGGEDGWAAAVAAALDGSDVPVNQRVAAGDATTLASAKTYADGQHINSMTGTETDKAPSVNAVKTHVTQQLAAQPQSCAGGATSGTDWVQVTYPAGVFSGSRTVRVVVQPFGTASVAIPVVDSSTTTGFRFRVLDAAGAMRNGVPVGWIAMEQ